MNTSSKQLKLGVPPFRATPETVSQIMTTTLITLLLPAGVAVFFFGSRALNLMVIGLVAALATEMICSRIRQDLSLGSTVHSLVIGLLLVLMLPAHCAGYVAMTGAVVAVALGKHVFGGLGHYLWHPALIGRVILELFFHDQLALSANSPLAGLRHFDKLFIENGVVQFGQYFLEYLPSLDKCMLGNVGGGLGEVNGVIVILAGLFLIYRGYLHWQLPAVFIASAYITVAFCPIFPMDLATGEHQAVYIPFMASGWDVGFTYANYHLFSGGLLLSAFLLSADMTSRPIVVRGQILYAGCAGVLAIILRYYSPIGIPSYVAILAMQTLIPFIDRMTRPSGRK
ncbi:MAG: RnfABCDGE type electron transport complex subunit D [Phycisphaerae bacterium]|nr:RnfABCDGE type electron transport complex subunit D [Phycisphaerae bacterium]